MKYIKWFMVLFVSYSIFFSNIIWDRVHKMSMFICQSEKKVINSFYLPFFLLIEVQNCIIRILCQLLPLWWIILHFLFLGHFGSFICNHWEEFPPWLLLSIGWINGRNGNYQLSHQLHSVLCHVKAIS